MLLTSLRMSATPTSEVKKEKKANNEKEGANMRKDVEKPKIPPEQNKHNHNDPTIQII